MDEKLVSVVIPSHNRGFILEKTIPSYYQKEVGEIIIVDDASTDNTEEVVKRIQKNIPILKYIKLKKNRKQTYAKNKGILNAKYPFIYFGDDDSFLTENTIGILLGTLMKYNADAVGAKVLYLKNKNDLLDIDKFIKEKNIFARDKYDIVDLKNWKIDFSRSVKEAIEVPFCHACALVKTNIAKETMFDTIYKGTAYREETDFFTRINRAGYKIYYNSNAMQINYPRDILNQGKADNRKSIKYIVKDTFYDIKNTMIYFNRHYAFLKNKYRLKDNKYQYMIKYIVNDIIYRSKYLKPYIKERFMN